MRAESLLLAIVLLFLGGCGGSPSRLPDDPADPLSPRYPESQSIRRPFVSNAEGLCIPGLPDCCFPLLSTWGTNDSIETVVSLYKKLGFRGEGGRIDPATGEETPDGDLVRWIGDRGEGRRWRKVDIAWGAIAGRPEWATVIQLFAPDPGCVD
jgi:hypothetical protein